VFLTRSASGRPAASSHWSPAPSPRTRRPAVPDEHELVGAVALVLLCLLLVFGVIP